MHNLLIMKIAFHIILALPVLMAGVAYGQVAKEGWKVRPDTTILRNKETGLTKKYPNSYNRQDVVVARYKPYFIKDFSKPGDFKTGAYTAYTRHAGSQLPVVEKALPQRLKESSAGRAKLLAHLKDTAEIHSCILVPVPAYYLTPNVVQYQSGENITSYFALDTSKLIYALVKNNQLVGMVLHHQGRSRLLDVSKADSISYAAVLEQREKPVAFLNHIAIDPANVGGVISNFGYVKDNRIIFSTYDEKTFRLEDVHGNTSAPQTEITYTLEPAEAYFAKGGSQSVLQQIVQRYYKNLESKP